MTTAPRTLTARHPTDLLAMAPVLLGFWPEESVVLLTLDAARPVHARIDLPPVAEQSPGLLRELETMLLDPARRQRARRIVLLYFSAEAGPASVGAVHRALRRGARRSGLEVVAALWADGECYRDLSRPGTDPGGDPGCPGRPYDVSCHPFVVEALVSGRLAHRSRAEMVASLDQDPAAAARVRSALAATGLLDDGVPDDGRSLHGAGRWVEAFVSARLDDQREPTDEEVARMLWVMQAARVRDAALSLIDGAGARAHVELWTRILRRSPADLAAAPAVLLGWAAWQSGDGARAWAAVDRCLAADPDYPLAAHLGSILQHALPPELWQPGFDWAAGLA